MGRTGRRRAVVRRSRAPLLLALVALLGIGVTVATSGLVPAPGPAGLAEDLVRGGAADEGAGAREPEAPDAARRDAAPDAASEATSAQAPAPIDVDLSNLPVPRTLDCPALDGDPVREALGAPVALRRGYVSGDRVEVTPGVTDVVAEDGCVFRSPRADARVWVFSAPVGTAYARRLVREARGVQGCAARPDETGFGDPTLTDVCTTEEPRTTTATLRGLFGDAWLTCRLSVQDAPEDEVLGRAQRWCTEVATVLGTGS